MQSIDFSDPAWQMTFPHRVAPRQEEWLAGLLLRYDEANHWTAGTTVAHLLRTNRRPSMVDSFNIIDPPPVYLERLSEVLAIPIPSLVATTYQTEVKRLSGVVDQLHWAHELLLQAHTSFRFSLCPQCVADTRMLTRSLILPHLTTCQKHHLALQAACRCGANLRLFHRKVPPFTCWVCGLEWGMLPRIKVSQDEMALDQRVLSYYEFFFSQGTPELLVSLLSNLEDYEMKFRKGFLLHGKGKQPVSAIRHHTNGILTLEKVVSLLVHWNLSIHDIKTWVPDHKEETRTSRGYTESQDGGISQAQEASHHVASFKFKVVLESLTSHSVDETARKYGLFAKQLSSWRTYFLEQGYRLFQTDPTKRERELEKQIATLEHMLSKKHESSRIKRMS